MGVQSPAKLIEMLYGGILRFSSFAKKAIEKEDIEEKIYYINRTTDIFTELIAILDYERGGEIAGYLTGLYVHQIKILAKANITNEVEHIDTVIRVVRGLLEAWREIHNNELS